MKCLIALALSFALILGCSSPNEPTTPKILDIWSHPILQNGNYRINAYMIIEGQGSWWFTLEINGQSIDCPEWHENYTQNGEGRVWTIFWYFIQHQGDTYTITGHHGGDSMVCEGVLP